jgi:hypothetical protein
MLQVEGAQACEGGRSKYELWMHHWSPEGRVALSRIALVGAYRQVERVLDVPEIPDPFTILGLAQNSPEWRARVRSVGMPAVTSVIRVCSLRTHRDTRVRTPQGSGRIEAVSRIVWLPSRTQVATVRADSIRLSERGVGVAQAVDLSAPIPAQPGTPQLRVPIGPIVSAPLTRREAAHAGSFSVLNVVATLPVNPNGHHMLAVLHPQLDQDRFVGRPVERLYVPEEHRLPVPA